MSIYRKEWECCGSATETDAWEPDSCPFCTDAICDTTSVASGAPTDDPMNSQYFGKLLSRLVEFGFDGGHDEKLIAWIRSYGQACAAAEREACAQVDFRGTIGLSHDQCYEVMQAIRNRK